MRVEEGQVHGVKGRLCFAQVTFQVSMRHLSGGVQQAGESGRESAAQRTGVG